MNPIRSLACVAVLPLVLVGSVPNAEAQEPGATPDSDIAALSWFAGCWRTADGLEERWTDGEGGQMMGHNRAFRDGKVVRWEFLRIYQGRTAPIYAAAPSHQPPAEFGAVVATADSAVFLNPEHDFPSGLTYRRMGTDSLVVFVFGPGEEAGDVRGFEIRFGRRSCDNPPG